MARLDEVRRRFPVGDRVAYDEAYAEAELAERVGGALYRLRAEAGLGTAELAERSGVAEAELVALEEGGSLPTLVQLARLGRALRAPTVLTLGEDELELGRPG